MGEERSRHVSLARVLRLAGAPRGPALQAEELADRAEPALAAGRRGHERRRVRRRLVRRPARRRGVFRSTEPAWNDRNLRDLAAHITSPRVFAHIRASTGSPVQQTNCHPFRHGQLAVDAQRLRRRLPRVKRDLALAVDPALFADIEGTTDTEMLFYLALTFGLRTTPRPPSRGRSAWSRRPGAGTASSYPMQGTVATTDGDTTWAFRYSSEGRSRSLFHSTDVSTLRAPVPRQPHAARPLRRRPARRLGAAR